MRSMVINAIAMAVWLTAAVNYSGLTCVVAMALAAVNGCFALSGAVYLGMERWSRAERQRSER